MKRTLDFSIMNGFGRCRKMAKWTMQGLNEYADFLQRIGKNTPEIIGVGVYEMASIVADKVRENLQSLPTVSNAANVATYKKGYSRLSELEKQGLLEGLGISPMENEDGYYNVKLGFDGYNSVKTHKYKQGQPNVIIARITESGSSYRAKTPFIRPAVNSTKNEAIKKAEKAIDEKIHAIENRSK